MAFLDYTGLQRFLGKLKGLFATFTNVATDESVANIQTAISTHASGLSDMEISPIKFSTASDVVSPFAASTTYLGFVRKSGTTLIVDAYGIGGIDQDIHGVYSSNTWTWESVNKKFALKPINVALDTVTNTSGAYTHTTTASGVTANMEAIHLEYSNPDAFLDSVTITTGANSITLECDNVEGTSDVTVTLLG